MEMYVQITSVIPKTVNATLVKWMMVNLAMMATSAPPTNVWVENVCLNLSHVLNPPQNAEYPPAPRVMAHAKKKMLLMEPPVMPMISVW